LRSPLVSVSSGFVVVDGIKPAEDGEGWVVRLYESHGGRVRARLTFGTAVSSVQFSNTLEDRLGPLSLEGGACEVDLRGFQLMTIRVA
jgi:alpha-mannosidase